MLQPDETRSVYDQMLDELVDLKIERTTLEERIDAIIKRVKELQDPLKKYFDMNPDRTEVVIKNHVVEMRHKIYASPNAPREQGCVALKNAGLGQYVSENYNLNSISAYVRELAEQVEPGNPVELPAELRDVFRVVELDEVTARKSGKSSSAKGRKSKSSDFNSENSEDVLWSDERIKELAGNEEP